MKHLLKLLPLAAAMLISACEGYTERMVQGTMYTDNTLTVPAVGEWLSFYETTDICLNAETHYLGRAVTDGEGKWAFQYIHNLDNPYRDENLAKTSIF